MCDGAPLPEASLMSFSCIPALFNFFFLWNMTGNRGVTFYNVEIKTQSLRIQIKLYGKKKKITIGFAITHALTQSALPPTFFKCFKYLINCF